MINAHEARVKLHPTQQQRAFLTSDSRFRLYVGGIGAGKTYAGAIEVLKQPPGSVGMVVAPTYPMLKDASYKTFIEIAEPLIIAHNRADMTARLVNGTEILFRSADNPDRLRGANLGWCWLDEGAYCKRDTWNVLIGRLRLDPGRAWVTTTPRGKNWLFDVFGTASPNHSVYRAPTTSNPYLPQHYIDSLKARYTTSQARQELEGEWLDVEGAVFRSSWIDDARIRPEDVPETRSRVVIGLDPAGTHRPDSDETGIVVCCTDAKGDGYVLEDASGRYAPNEWARAVRRLYDEYAADAVIAERNFGGDMVEATLRAYGGQHIRVKTVVASRGKAVRAEPLAAPYEQARIHHSGVFPDLERQMTTFDPKDRAAESPDRMDALVWALSDLMLSPTLDYSRVF